MCGLVGVVAERDVTDILLEGLRRLEYRGYDSAGLALVMPGENATRTASSSMQRVRQQGKVAELAEACHAEPIKGFTGIAHTRWATHGEPSEINAHPITAATSTGQLAVVHNGIVENHEGLRAELAASGLVFESQTDTEVIAQLLARELDKGGDLRLALINTLKLLKGASALAVIHENHPDRLLAARLGSPLVVGLGIGENYLASDTQALRPVTDRFVFLDDGEVVEVTKDQVNLIDGNDHDIGKDKSKGRSTTSLADRVVTLNNLQGGRQVRGARSQSDGYADGSWEDSVMGKGNYRHYMQKEIFEMPEAVTHTLHGKMADGKVLPEAFAADGDQALDRLKQVQAVQIVACGSSFYTGLVARHWFEEYLNLPCQVEIASEFRYRNHAVLPGTLLIALSQSGETADTLAALRAAEDPNYLASLCINNVPNSTMTRVTDFSMMMAAGPEICVASTKTFVTLLADLLLLLLAIAQARDLATDHWHDMTQALHDLPQLLEQALQMDADIQQLAESFVDKHHALFLGRGSHYPIALEGALKLKEISYIHAEGYPAGELKHGPLALVDDDMPVVVVAPDDDLLEKLKSNLEEVRARGAQLFVFAAQGSNILESESVKVLRMPTMPAIISPIVFALPLQLLAYHVAVFKGTDVDQPRNLAKSVTVE